MNKRGCTAEYIDALKASPKFGPQVCFHKTIPAIQAVYGSVNHNEPLIFKGLQSLGIKSLYSHQSEAVQLLDLGKNILVATPTASGKSLIYTFPVFSRIIRNPDAKALYLFPLKALARDQLRIAQEFHATLEKGTEISKISNIAAVYDGDTSAYKRKKIRDNIPPILITNPDMLHLSMLAYHQTWASFFKNLKYIVIDEVHTYRGIFGSHMAWVLQRLQRIAEIYGSSPQFILLSATIGNPDQLGQTLLGRPVSTITASGAPQAGKQYVFIDPWDSPAYTASQLLIAALKRGLRTIVYTKSRKMTELIAMWTKPGLGNLAGKLSSYRAGFLPEERREIEQQLTSGSLLGVISTSALELGIDIGDLDLCIMVGYPGSLMSAWQRGGRVGRRGKESAVILIAGEDALDHYFIKHPETYFDSQVESAVLNPQNEIIMQQHLHCAAAEIPLQQDEKLMATKAVQQTVDLLTSDCYLFQTLQGDTWISSRKFPQKNVHIRGGSGGEMAIINQVDGEIIGSIDSGRALHECHNEAVYLHRGRSWLVQKLDIAGKEIVVKNKKVNFFTRVQVEKQTEILGTRQVKEIAGYRVSLGQLRVTERLTGYQKRSSNTNKLIGTYPLNLPDQVFETTGIWLDIPNHIQVAIEQAQHHFMGAIHALEHGLISLFPFLVLCDRNDIGGISCPFHEQTEFATVFIYDGYAGGIGLTAEAFQKINTLLVETETVINDCSCTNGCPACVHSPKCGSGNRPIDKEGSLELVTMLLSQEQPEDLWQKKTQSPVRIEAQQQKKIETNLFDAQKIPEHYGVFDLETIRSAKEVGGWHRAEKMGISVGVIYDSRLDGCVSYLENDIQALVDHLQQLDLVVGFNNKRFDNRVLSGYTGVALHLMPTLDLLEEVNNHLGYRLSLDRLAEHTLGVKKTGDGLLALKWYKEGKMRELQEYCQKDVEITRDLFHFAWEKGYLLFQNKAGSIVRLPLNLQESFRDAVQSV